MKDMKFAKYDDRGQGFKLYVTCESNDRFFYSSPRITFSIRLLGVCVRGIWTLCNLRDVGAQWSKCVDNIESGK